MRLSKIKTIDVNAKQWRDHFSAVITVNYKLPGQRHYYLLKQYGYGDHYQDMALRLLAEKESQFKKIDTTRIALWHACDDLNIILRTNVKDVKYRQL